MTRFHTFAVLLLVTGCGPTALDQPGLTDAGTIDAGTPLADAGAVIADAGLLVPDAGQVARDAGVVTSDAGVCTTDTHEGWPAEVYATNCAWCHHPEVMTSSTLREKIATRQMPKIGSLTDVELERFLKWLDCGQP